MGGRSFLNMTTHVKDLIEPFFIVHWALGLWTTAQRYFRSINAGPHILLNTL